MTQHETRVGRSPRRHRIHGIPALGWSALLLSLLLVVVACGNDDGDDATEAAAEATVAATTASDADDGGADDDGGGDATQAAEAASLAASPASGDEGGGGDAIADSDGDGVPDTIEDLASDSGSATVTIGDETFEFSLAGTSTIDGTTYVGRCESFFEMILGSGFATDGRDITVYMEIPPVDWESYEDERFDPPKVEVEDNTSNANWVADQGDEFAAGGSVGEYEQEGVTASGSAAFVNQWATDSEPVEGSFEIDCEG